jgi:hypothetical protein
VPPTAHKRTAIGVDSPITKNRKGIDFLIAYLFLLSYFRKAEKSNCILVTNEAFHLQNRHFVCKSGISFTNIYV